MKTIIIILISILATGLISTNHEFYKTWLGEKITVTKYTYELTENIAIDLEDDSHFFFWRHPRFSTLYFRPSNLGVAGVSGDDLFNE